MSTNPYVRIDVTYKGATKGFTLSLKELMRDYDGRVADEVYYIIDEIRKINGEEPLDGQDLDACRHD